MLSRRRFLKTSSGLLILYPAARILVSPLFTPSSAFRASAQPTADPPLKWRLLTTDIEYNEAGTKRASDDYTPLHLARHIVPAPFLQRFAYYSADILLFKTFVNAIKDMTFQGFAIVDHHVLATPEEQEQMKEESCRNYTSFFMPVHNISICKYKGITIAGPVFGSGLRVILIMGSSDRGFKPIIGNLLKKHFGESLSTDEEISYRKQLLGNLLTTFFSSIENTISQPIHESPTYSLGHSTSTWRHTYI